MTQNRAPNSFPQMLHVQGDHVCRGNVGENIESETYLWSERNLEPDGNSRTALHSTPVFVLQCFHSGPFASASSPLSSAISLILTSRICVHPPKAALDVLRSDVSKVVEGILRRHLERGCEP